MKKFIAVFLCLSFLVFLFSPPPLAAQSGITRLSDTQAEDIYSQALNFYSHGNSDQAVKLLKYLLENGYTDRYIYFAVLDIYAYKISQAQLLSGSNNKNYFDLLSDARKTAAQGMVLYPNEKKLFYRYADFSRSLGDTTEFYQSLRQILKLDTDDIFANYWLGAYHFLNREYDQATVYFQKVIANPMTSQEFEAMAIYRSYYNLGVIAVNDLNYKLGIQYLEKARSIYGKDYELIRTIAFTYAEMLEWDSAIENFLMIPEMFRNEEIAGIFAGVLLVKNDGRLDKLIMEYKSESAFVDAVDLFLKKDYAESLTLLGQHISSKNYADFYSHYLLYLNYNALGDVVKASQQAFLLGNRAKEVGKYDTAIGYYMSVEKNTNSVPEIYWLIGSLYDDVEQNLKAVSYYEKYLSHPGSKEYRIPAMVRLSYLYYKSGNRRKADAFIALAKKTAEKKDELYQVHFYSGLIYLEIKNYKSAIRDFEKALNSDSEAGSKDSRLFYFMATAQYENRDTKKAIRTLETARTHDKNSPEINNLLAYLYSIERTNLDEALRLVNLALIFSQENIAYLDTQAWIYFQKNDLKSSYEIFERIQAMLTNTMEKEAGFDEIYYHLGMVYEKMGKETEAKSFYRKGYKINSKNPLLKKKVK